MKEGSFYRNKDSTRRRNMKGAFVFSTLLEGLIALIFLAAVLPTMSTTIYGVTHNTTENAGVDSLVGSVLVLFPLIMLLAVIVALLDYNKPQVVQVE